MRGLGAPDDCDGAHLTGSSLTERSSEWIVKGLPVVAPTSRTRMGERGPRPYRRFKARSLPWSFKARSLPWSFKARSRLVALAAAALEGEVYGDSPDLTSLPLLRCFDVLDVEVLPSYWTALRT